MTITFIPIEFLIYHEGIAMIFFAICIFGGPLSNKLKPTGVAGPVTKTGIARVRHPVNGMFKPREGLGFEKMTGTFCLETRRVLLPTKCEGIKILTISNIDFFWYSANISHDEKSQFLSWGWHYHHYRDLKHLTDYFHLRQWCGIGQCLEGLLGFFVQDFFKTHL